MTFILKRNIQAKVERSQLQRKQVYKANYAFFKEIKSMVKVQMANVRRFSFQYSWSARIKYE